MFIFTAFNFAMAAGKFIKAESPVFGSAANFVIEFFEKSKNLSVDDAKKFYSDSRKVEITEKFLKYFKESSFNDESKYLEKMLGNGFVEVTIKHELDDGTRIRKFMVKKFSSKWLFADEIMDKNK